MLTMPDAKPSAQMDATSAEPRHTTCRWCGLAITGTKHADLITNLIDHVDKEHLT